MSLAPSGLRTLSSGDALSLVSQNRPIPSKSPRIGLQPDSRAARAHQTAMGNRAAVQAQPQGDSEAEPSGQVLPVTDGSDSSAPLPASREKPESKTSANASPQQASGATGEAQQADSLATELENLKIRPDESDQNDQSSDEEGDYASILTKMRQAFAADKKKPKEVLAPLLQTFDLAGVADYIKKGKAKKIIVMCGAGISVSAGIPDFRSPKTGLYHNLKKFNLPHPQAVFELDYFRQQPKAFYQLAKELFPGRFKPTPAHYFMTLLHQKGLLLRCFTQNIDSLEREAHLPREKVVAAHGNFDTAHCISCHREVAQGVVRKAVDEGKICTCPTCDGYVKPDIVFFGENLPEDFFLRAQSDFPQADMLLVMGTSLIVNPFASLIDHVGDQVPRVLINRERVGEADAALLLWGHRKGFAFDEKHRDALFLGDCDDAVRSLAQLLGWEKDLDALINAGSLSNL